jgi:hypothetical protein
MSKTEPTKWHVRFRQAAYTAAVGAAIWSLMIIVPFAPFSFLPPIIVGGGAGAWFALGYVLYIAAGFGSTAALSALLYQVELGEGKRVSGALAGPGLVLLYAGVTSSSLLLATAGYAGGYARSIQHMPDQAIEAMLLPYVNPVSVGVMMAVVGALLTIAAMATASRPKT